MSPARSGSTPVTFEIKSASLSLLALHLKSADLDALAGELEALYGDTPDFFEDDLLVIDLAPVSEAAAGLDFERLKAMLTRYRLRPVVATGGAPELMAAAHAAGLSAPSDWHVTQSAQQASSPSSGEGQPKQSGQLEPFAMPSPAPGALVVDKPLRSGQQVYARGRDLVLLAVCNPGAEAIADGHVHVYAPLRGRAIAGARGWNQAHVFALDMRPELVSIAGVYRTSEQSLAPDVWGHAAMVHLAATRDGDTLLFRAMT